MPFTTPTYINPAAKAAAELDASTLHHPRILCLHGGGTNARIFAAQCRGLRKSLAPHFRLVFPDAPFLSDDPGPDVVAVYKHMAPFRRWFKFRPHQPMPANSADAVAAIDACIDAALREDEARGADGPVVAVLGFSQGAKLAASLLLRQQLRERAYGFGALWRRDPGLTAFRFGVLMAGRGPLVSFEPELLDSPALVDACANTLSPVDLPPRPTPGDGLPRDHIIDMPTLHVLGRQDPHVGLHNLLLERYCDEDFARTVLWDGAHRIPFKRADVAAVVDQILELAQETGVLGRSYASSVSEWS